MYIYLISSLELYIHFLSVGYSGLNVGPSAYMVYDNDYEYFINNIVNCNPAQ